MLLLYCEGPRILCDPDRIANPIARLRGENCNSRPLSHDAKLVHRIGTLQVSGDEQWSVALTLELEGQLPRERGLASTLKPGKHDDGRRLLREANRPSLAAEDGDEFLVNNLHDLLRRVQRP